MDQFDNIKFANFVTASLFLLLPIHNDASQRHFRLLLMEKGMMQPKS